MGLGLVRVFLVRGESNSVVLLDVDNECHDGHPKQRKAAKEAYHPESVNYGSTDVGNVLFEVVQDTGCG